jgi:hypothetical protein
MPKVITFQDRKKIVELYQKETPIEDIIKEMGVVRSSIFRIINSYDGTDESLMSGKPGTVMQLASSYDIFVNLKISNPEMSLKRIYRMMVEQYPNMEVHTYQMYQKHMRDKNIEGTKYHRSKSSLVIDLVRQNGVKQINSLNKEVYIYMNNLYLIEDNKVKKIEI